MTFVERLGDTATAFGVAGVVLLLVGVILANCSDYLKSAWSLALIGGALLVLTLALVLMVIWLP